MIKTNEKKVVITSAVRTPVGTLGGSLKNIQGHILGSVVIKEVLKINTNFNYKRITTLYSNLSSLNFFQIIELKNNYKKLNYSLTEVNMQILKIIAFPLYLVLITILSALIMFKIKRLDTTTFKISLGLFISVIIYYINNFFLVMGNTERIPLIFAIFTPLVILGLFNTFMIYKINEK